VRALRDSHPEVWLSVSATTRAPRPGEIEGDHYRFVDDATFDASVSDGELLEWATYAGHRYGTPRGAVDQHLAAGQPVLLEIEIQGARQVRAARPDAYLVFLAPPSLDVLVERLVGRGTEDSSSRERRLQQARIELAAEPEFDLTLVNRDVREVVDRLVALMGL
jgi:guanylate kinase